MKQKIVRKIQKYSLVLSFVILTIVISQISFPQLNNWKLKLSEKDSSYLQLKPLDGSILSQEINSADGYPGEAYPVGQTRDETIIPSVTIHYYASPGDIQPTYTVHAGRTYVNKFFWGYGHTSWPTYSKEWRYVQPFLEKSNGASHTTYEELLALPYYYVQYSDLEKISEGKGQDLLYYDHWLCELGLYYSPNLPIFLDIWNISFLAAGLLLLGVTLFWMHKSRKKDAGSQELINNSDKAISV